MAQPKVPNPREYFVYFWGLVLRGWGKRPAAQPQTIYSELPLGSNRMEETRTCKSCKSTKPLIGFSVSLRGAGLLTGGDIAAGLEGISLYDELLIPAVSLRNERDIFLDDMSVEELSQKLNVKVTSVENDGFEMLDKILGEQEG